jgi:hypothetical protein
MSEVPTAPDRQRLVFGQSGLASRRLLPTLSLLMALGWAVIRSGPDFAWVLEDAYAAALIWPQRLTDVNMTFYTDSPLGWVAFKFFPGQTLYSFALFGTMAAVGATATLLSWMAVASESGSRIRAMRLAILCPLFAVLFAWLGFYDSWTLLAWVVALYLWLTGSRIALAAGGLLLGFQHFEQGILGIVALWLTWLAVGDRLRAPINRLSPLWILPGLLVGKAVLLAVTAQESSSRSAWLLEHLRSWTVTGVSVGPVLAWSLFAGSWGLVIWLWLSVSERRSRVYLILALTIGLAATFISGDRPRVFIIVMAPALLVAILVFVKTVRQGSTESRIVEALMWLAPPLLLWGKTIVNSDVANPLYTTIVHLIHPW